MDHHLQHLVVLFSVGLVAAGDDSGRDRCGKSTFSYSILFVKCSM